MLSNGQRANETTFNDAYLSKDDVTTANKTTGIIGLDNSSDMASGNQILNTQRLLNEVSDSDGTVGEGDSTRKEYSSNNVVADGDSRKVALGKIDAKFNESTGHNHDGSSGNGAPVFGASVWQNISFQGTLADNQSSPAMIVQFDVSLVCQADVSFVLTRGSLVRAGDIRLTTDGTDAVVTWDDEEPFGDCGITFTADVSGGNMRLLYASTNTGTAPKIILGASKKLFPT